MGKRTDREGPIQRSIVMHLRAVLPGAIVHHCKNEINKRGQSIMLELAKAKSLGAVKGFPDLLVLPAADIGPFFLEIKAPGNYPTDSQREVHDQMDRLGYRVAVVRSVDEVRAVLRLWGVPTAEVGE